MTAESAVEYRAGREAPPFTAVYDWVALSGVSPAAHSLYVKLRMHVDMRKGDGRAWPGTDAQALLMGFNRGDKVTRYLAELEAIGAIEIHRENMPRRNVYTVHQMPPANHDGPVRIADWYERNRPQLDAMRAAEQAKRAKRKKAQVRTDTPERGGQDEPPLPEWADTPAPLKRGGPSCPPQTRGTNTPWRGGPTPPVEGGNNMYSPCTEKNSPPPPPPPVAHAERANAREGEGGDAPDHGETIAAVRALRPTWRTAAIAAALEHPDVVERGRAVAAAALLMLAQGDYGWTNGPGRLRTDGPWWGDAEAALRPPQLAPAPRPRCAVPGCHNRKVIVETADHRDKALYCPDCDPAGHGSDLVGYQDVARGMGIELVSFADLVAFVRREPAVT